MFFFFAIALSSLKVQAVARADHGKAAAAVMLDPRRHLRGRATHLAFVREATSRHDSRASVAAYVLHSGLYMATGAPNLVRAAAMRFSGWSCWPCLDAIQSTQGLSHSEPSAAVWAACSNRVAWPQR